MNRIEIDPIFSQEFYASTYSLEVAPDSENKIRDAIDNLLECIKVVDIQTDVEEGFSIIAYTKSAEFKLPNGDRIGLDFTTDTSSEDGIYYYRPNLWQYTVSLYQPFGYDEDGRLLIRKRSFNLSFDEDCTDNTAHNHTDEQVEIVPIGKRSSLMTIISTVMSSPDFEVDEEKIHRIVSGSIALHDLEKDLLLVTPEKLGYIYQLLLSLSEENLIPDNQLKWSKVGA